MKHIHMALDHHGNTPVVGEVSIVTLHSAFGPHDGILVIRCAVRMTEFLIPIHKAKAALSLIRLGVS